jgi:malate dehydrogenase (oxaloacetate-decarboxylating)
LKGALVVRARKVTDEMAIEAAYSIARAAEKNGLRPDYIVPTMEEDIYPTLATDVAMQAIKDGVARKEMDRDEIFASANKSIKEARSLINHLMQEDFIKKPPMDFIEKAVELAVAAVK